MSCAHYVGGEKGEGPRVRKPTIIEEMPEDLGEKPGVIPEKPGRSVEKPQGPAGATPGTRPGTVARSAVGPAAHLSDFRRRSQPQINTA